jgi:hypothetical protein
MKAIMQKFILKTVGLVLLTGTLIFNACTPDDGTDGGGNDVAPQASLVAETGFISANSEVDAGSIFKVKLRTTPGTNQIKTVEILEEGVKLATTRFTINAGAITANNPFLITGTAKGGATYDIAIQASTNAQETKRYTFVITDDNNLTDEVTVDITTKGTLLEELTGKLLRNQDGPAGQGGLDLDTGESVGSVATSTGNPAIDTSYKRAEINDEGNVSTSNSTWRQVISPTNGAAVRYIDKGKLPETFSFETVKTQEEIVGAFDSGIKFTAVGGDFESNKLVEGDVFTVKTADNRYFIIKVTKITVTAGDNNDSYTFSIKKKK